MCEGRSRRTAGCRHGYVVAAVAAIALVLPPALVRAQLLGDANCDGILEPSDADAILEALYTPSNCSETDVNRDGRVSAADLVAIVPWLTGPAATPTPTSTGPSPTATASGTSTATPSPSASATATPTATFDLCPSPATVRIAVDNQTGTTPIAFSLSGTLLQATCRNTSALDETYSLTTSDNPASVSTLAPGVWVHSIRMNSPATGQLQYQSGLVLANVGPNDVRFTAFASVKNVLNPNDGLGSGTLRDALLAAPSAPKPHLIQFDEVLFPSGSPTAITLNSAPPPLTASNVTIDGTDGSGAAGNRIIDAGGRQSSALGISGAMNHIVGLRLRNTGANNRDVVSITGSSATANVIERCIIEESATGDGVGIDAGAGSDLLASANIVRDCEISGASDKGVKVTTNSYARVEGNWVHDNANGGIQSTLSAHVWSRDNLVERNAGNADARNGLSVNGTAPDTPQIASELLSSGDISRFNGGNGVSLRGLSTATLNDDYLAANQHDGLRIATEITPATAVVQGTTFACNAVNGAVVELLSQADFGGGALRSPGSNAFTENNLTGGFDNLFNQTAAALFAVNNQWEHCGRNTTCDDASIAAYDVSDHGRFTLFAPSQAHRSHLAPAVTGVRPSKGVAGDLVRIFGSGFNVIDGHAADATCPNVAARNRCVPLRGNCVRIGDVAAPIEAVTPTMIAVRLPLSCVQPMALTVATQEGGISAPVMFCTNAVQ
ncbi:MAG: right-handed parallel beta-helix repeat-containing protein [Deltaproteobacteria bacterium]|nr:right-handed parallel beta-helix repeat-containing protein [Deltaproteobacteria bacterium]